MSSSEDPTRIHPTAPAPPPRAAPPGGLAAPAEGERLTPREPGPGGPGSPGEPPLPPTGGGGGGGGWDDGPGEPNHDERNRNWILAVIAGALVLIAVFLALNLSQDDEDDGRIEPTTPAAVTPPATSPASTPTPEPETTPEPQPDEPQESADNGGGNSSSGGGAPIDGGDVQPADDGPLLEPGGVTKITATQGDAVTFQVKSAQDEEVHVHGYDLKYDIAAGETKTISFDASLTGIFEIEFEGSGEQIGELTVEP